MKQIVILKLDTPCTLIESACHVPQAEVLNFCEYIAKVGSREKFEFLLLGLSAQKRELAQGNGTIEVLPYFGHDPSVMNRVTKDATVILWQGRHAIQINTPHGPEFGNNKPVMTEPYDADFFEKLSLIKSWQIQMYNLMANKFKYHDKKYFILTDLRLPLLEMHLIEPDLVPNPLPKGIKMLTQAFQAEAAMNWINKYANGQWYPEIEISDYMYKFEEAEYLPLHMLPIMSHSKFHKPMSEKTELSAIYQVQSFKYLDDYRKKKLKVCIEREDGNVALMGRFGPQEHALLQYEYHKYYEKLKPLVKGSSSNAIAFFDAAKQLAEYEASLVITDGRYARFGLCPNRFIEALAVGTLPVLPDHEVLEFADPRLREAYSGISATKPMDVTEKMQNTLALLIRHAEDTVMANFIKLI